MTDDQIKVAIRSGRPFFAVNSKHEMIPRYMYFAPVFKWEKNQMLPTPFQGEDLIWWMSARDEDLNTND
jgi:hypothetical protein